MLNLWRGELGTVRELAQATLVVAKAYEYPIWTALGLLVDGVAMAGLGQPGEGLAQMEQGLAMYQGMSTPPIFWPLVLYIRGQAHRLSGQPEIGID